MGILNVTPDSFSDGGRYSSKNQALEHAEQMITEGVDWIDIGGESTRPGSESVTPEVQIKRVVPIIKAIRENLSKVIPISIDTTQATVAQAAIEAGATVINDVSAARDDKAMLACAVAHQTPIILMHMQGQPKNMQENPAYSYVIDDVFAFLLQRAEAAQQAGVLTNNIILDPGIGFGKRKQDNLLLMAHLEALVDLGYPVLLGASRKRFMGSVCQVTEPSELAVATAVTTALGVMAGVKLFRVHDVAENRQALDVSWAIRTAKIDDAGTRIAG
ncbi:MAG: dihydropteroate synthase [Methylococcales bacterium]